VTSISRAETRGNRPAVGIDDRTPFAGSTQPKPPGEPGRVARPSRRYRPPAPPQTTPDLDDRSSGSPDYAYVTDLIEAGLDPRWIEYATEYSGPDGRAFIDLRDLADVPGIGRVGS
jgi:hypothetical protein